MSFFGSAHRVLCALVLLLLGPSSAMSIDNPEIPDLVAEFRARSGALESSVADAAGGNSSAELGAWIQFLEGELDLALSELAAALPCAERELLSRSQSAWRTMQDAELQFARALWTQERFGSSFRLSIGLSKANALEFRILQLLRTRMTLPPDAAHRLCGAPANEHEVVEPAEHASPLTN